MHTLPIPAPTAKRSANMNLSFSGCGFLGVYHVGVAACFREYAPHVLVEKIAGASAGVLAACALICNVPLGQSTSDVLRVAVKARSRALGPLHPGFDINKVLHEGLSKMLPDDCHLRCNGRLHVSVTRVSDGENVLLTQFDSKEDLIQALLCSCFIPFYSGIVPPKFHGVAYMDGGLSDNVPVLDNNTVTVCPFAGESDICPRDNNFNLFQVNVSNTSFAISTENIYRLANTLFPPSPEVLAHMCQQGFDDALKFLQRHNLISCTRCLAVQTRFKLTESESLAEEDDVRLESDLDHSYDDCRECRYRRQMALLDSLPDTVVEALQETFDEMNKGVINWLFHHRPMKLISIITIPYVLPFDIAVVIFCKIWEWMPHIQKDVQQRLLRILALAKSLIARFDKKGRQYVARFTCRMAITEFNYSSEDTVDGPVGGTYVRLVPLASGRSKSLEEVRERAKGRPTQRKSYAGRPSFRSRQSSLVDSNGSERLLRSMNIGFTVNISPTVTSTENAQRDVMTTFQNIGEENSELDAIEISNRALNLKRQYLSRSDLESQSADTFEKLLDVTSKQDSLMSFYYMDANNRVTVTEIFNVTEADTNAILPEAEGDQSRESDSDTEDDSDRASVTSEGSGSGTEESDQTSLSPQTPISEDLGNADGGSFEDFCLSLNTPTSEETPRRKSSFSAVNNETVS